MNEDNFGAFAGSYLQADAHWGSDLDVLRSAFESVSEVFFGQELTYADIGCGPGFHLSVLERMYPKVHMMGVDFSSAMLKEAGKNVSRKVDLVQLDLIDRCHLLSPKHLVSYLNNGLGNLYRSDTDPTTTRKAVMRSIRDIVWTKGVFVASVYHLKKLALQYGHKVRILGEKSNPDIGELFIEGVSPDGQSVEFYSHWFTKDEFVGLLEESGFRVELLEERMARLVVKARAA